jgi:hypothetical protein
MKKHLLTILLACGVASAKPIEYNQHFHISELNLNKQKAITKNFSNTELNTINSEIKINLEKIEVLDTDKKYQKFTSSELSQSGKIGEPISYTSNSTVKLPHNAVITNITLSDGVYVEINSSAKIAPSKPILSWTAKYQQEDKELSEIYKMDKLYPQETFTYTQGKTNKNLLVYINLNTIYFNPVTQKTYVIKDAKFEIDYFLEEEQNSLNFSPKSENYKNIIITSESLLEAAERLKEHHENYENTPTKIITTEFISDNISPKSPPNISGAGTDEIAGVNEELYDYELAKKITRYLDDSQTHSNLESVTILGDAKIVPPSYYFFHNMRDDPEDFNSNVVSDIFYSSPDYDYVLNYAVGRIPVNNLLEANNFVNKIENWKEHQGEEWTKNVEFIGGQPFNTEMLIGEIMLSYSTQSEWLNGYNVNKNYLSNATNTLQSCMPIFGKGETGIIYHIDHGLYSGMCVNDKSIITNKNMNALIPQERYPILFSIACMNGGFDGELVKEPYGNSRLSFSEAFLNSAAGGIAYYGGTRINFGEPITNLTEASTIEVSGITGMGEILTSCIKNISEVGVRLGDIYKNAFTEYIKNNGEEEQMGMFTAHEFVFLGDPVCSFEPVSELPKYNAPTITPEKEWDIKPIIDAERVAHYKCSQGTNTDYTFGVSSNSPSVSVSNLEIQYQTQGNSNTPVFILKDRGKIDKSENTNTISAVHSRGYLSVYETDDFKETRLYFKTVEVENLLPSPFEITDIVPITKNSFRVEWSPSIDSDGSIESYHLREFTNLDKTTSTCDNTGNWQGVNNYLQVRHDETKGSNTLALIAPEKQLYQDSTISMISTAPVLIETGDNLEFDMIFDVLGKKIVTVNIYVSEDLKNFEPIKLDAISYNKKWDSFSYDLSKYKDKEVYFKFEFDYQLLYYRMNIAFDNIYPLMEYEVINDYENISKTEKYLENKPIDVYAYSVRAKDNSGAYSPWTPLKKINTANPVEDDTLEDISIYPNPVNTNLFIDTGANEIDFDSEIEIYNQTGDLVHTKVIKSMTNIQELDLSSLATGIYIIKYQINHKIYSAKITVN